MSWNVNGLRAAVRQGFVDALHEANPDVYGVQEVRAELEQIPDCVREPRGFATHFVAASRKGYSGVGLFARPRLDAMYTTIGVPRFDLEGRVQIARFGRLVVANVYFPNGNGKDRDNGRVPYKLAFYRRLFDELARWRRAGYRVLVMGDFNTAHRELDLARPKQNAKTSGFLPQERAEFDRWIRAGWVDTFRAFEPGGGHYTWWSQRVGVRAKNIGWRIDYVLATPATMRYVTDAFIRPEQVGSDHCPIGVDLDPAVVR
jgi:exodeoxyribonuclease III